MYCDLFWETSYLFLLKQVYRRRNESRRSSKPKLHYKKKYGCEVSRVRAMLLMSVAYNFFTTIRPTILLLVYLPLNLINQHQDSDVKCV